VPSGSSKKSEWRERPPEGWVAPGLVLPTSVTNIATEGDKVEKSMPK
jgi:hypothetical protein